MNRFRFHLGDYSSARGAIDYLHGNKCSPSGALTVEDQIMLQISIPRLFGSSAVSVVCYSESGDWILTAEAAWHHAKKDLDAYRISLTGRLNVGLYYYTVEITTADGNLYAYCNNGEIRFTSQPPSERFQLSISDFAYPAPKNLYGGVIYHIFVDRFARGGSTVKKDGTVMVSDWSEGIPEYPEYPGAHLKNNTFYGGTLWGIRKKLPYISSLGVTALYLSPIFDAASNHKYDTADYMSVDAMFGGDRALKSLISYAKKLGISIILDGVFNHTGDNSVYFNKYNTYKSVGAYNSQASPYYKWYDFKSYPHDYTSWWDIEILPRINPDNPDCRKYFIGDGGVVDKYARMGVGGFRLDVVDELSDDFVEGIKRTLSRAVPESVLYGEVWEDASNKIAYEKRKRYYLGKELDGVMNYPLRAGIIDFLTTHNEKKLRYALTTVTYNAPKRIRDAQMNLLGTHDTLRIMTALGGESPDGKSNEYLRKKRMSEEEYELAKSRLKMAYTIAATLPGIPMVFYGDEAGLEGYRDPFNRMPFPWGSEDGELVRHYRKIGDIRRRHRAYANGEYKLITLTPNLLIFARYGKNSVYLTVVNNSDGVIALHTEDSSMLTPLINKELRLAPYTSEVFKAPLTSSIFYNYNT